MFTEGRIDLLAGVPLLKRVLKARAFQPATLLLTLAVFTLAILAGIAGTPAGSRNFGIIFVWIVWWALVMTPHPRHAGALRLAQVDPVVHLPH